MTQILSSFSRDANGIPIWTEGIVASKSITYVAGTTGAEGTTTLFTVTGCVAVRVFGVCGTSIEGAATLEVGITGSTASILAQIADATALLEDELYIDATPTTKVDTLPNKLVIGNGQDIIQTIGSTVITAGQITYYCIWSPISLNADVTAS